MATAGNDDDEVEVDEEDEEAQEGGDFDTSLKLFVKKANGQKKKKPGRKAKWCPQALDDLYGDILKEVKARASARGEHFDFSANQLRSKFKKCVSLCKQAALTQKSATGIKRFQEDQGLGTWFTTLFEVVKTRESCQPNLALEPSASSSPNDLSVEISDNSVKEKELFVLIKTKRRQLSKKRLDSAITEVLTLVREIVLAFAQPQT